MDTQLSFDAQTLTASTAARDKWQRERDAALAQVEKNAGRAFAERARAFVVDYLDRHAAASGEVITEACKRAGIRPHDDRAFGPVYMALSRAGLIEKCGSAIRKRGHGCAGGNVWRRKAPVPEPAGV